MEDGGITFGAVLKEALGPVVTLVVVAVIAWLRKMAKKMRAMADAMASAPAMEERLTSASEERDKIRGEAGRHAARLDELEGLLKSAGAQSIEITEDEPDADK